MVTSSGDLSVSKKTPYIQQPPEGVPIVSLAATHNVNHADNGSSTMVARLSSSISCTPYLALIKYVAIH